MDLMPKTDPNRLQTEPKDQENFCALKFADVGKLAGKPGVDMVTFDPQRRRGRIVLAAHVAPETLKHELDHVALPMMRRRRVGKNKKLHADKVAHGIWDIPME
jgi:hypothetical protein